MHESEEIISLACVLDPLLLNVESGIGFIVWVDEILACNHLDGLSIPDFLCKVMKVNWSIKVYRNVTKVIGVRIIVSKPSFNFGHRSLVLLMADFSFLVF